jgi:hypothetical protein
VRRRAQAADRKRDQSNDADRVVAHVDRNVQQPIDNSRSGDDADDSKGGCQAEKQPARRPNDVGDSVVVVRGKPFRDRARQRPAQSKIEQ